MTTINGSTDSLSSSSHQLGKRKRTMSQENSNLTEPQETLQQTLQTIFNIVQKNDPNPSILQYPLPPSSEEPDSKRARLSSTEPDNIESRLNTGFYTSANAILDDIDTAKDAILFQLDNSGSHGKTRSSMTVDQEAREHILLIVDSLSGYRNSMTASIKQEQKEHSDENKDDEINGTTNHSCAQVLSLRGQTDRGVQQLYSGLQTRTPSCDIPFKSIDGRKLPNGFELADPATLDVEILSQAKKKRLFGDVFRPHRNLKQLELPRAYRHQPRGRNLEFMPVPILERFLHYQYDYQSSSLPMGNWLRYNDNDALTQDGKAESTPKSAEVTKPETSSGAGNDEKQIDAIFKSVYSSFAPTSDNSKAVLSEGDRARRWWRKYGQDGLSLLFGSKNGSNALNGENPETLSSTEADFEQAVTLFEPEEEKIDLLSKPEPSDVDDILQEISDLLRTLNSYQTTRNLESRTTVESRKIADGEFDTYEILRSQLSILINSLPPFAVAKLDGDQLQALNITTNIMVDAPDFSGTGQPDDFTLRRFKAAQVATSAAGRTAPTPQVRPNYQTPGVAPNAYNAQTRGYNNPVPGSGAYGARPITNYQTPRPAASIQRPSYAPTSYQPTSNSYTAQNGAQPYQRPVQNGFGAYSNTSAQPNYVQRPQDQAFARNPSPAKPVVTGQANPNYSSRPYLPQAQGSFSPSVTTATPDQRAIMERVRAAQTVSQAQQQAV